MFDTTEVVEIASRCTPNRLDRNQPRWVSPPVVGAAVNWPVKYGFGCALRIDFGDPKGDAGKDFEPRLDIYLGLDIRSDSVGRSKFCSGSASPTSARLKLKKKEIKEILLCTLNIQNKTKFI